MELFEMAEAFDREIKRTIRDNDLNFEVFEGAERQELIERLYATFLSEAGQRVRTRTNFVWCYLKYRPDAIDCGGKDPYWSFEDIFDREQVMYFFIPNFRDDNLYVFKARMADIHTFVGDCEGLGGDYYLMSADGQELYCATHHDDLLHVDVRTSRLREAAEK